MKRSWKIWVGLLLALACQQKDEIGPATYCGQPIADLKRQELVKNIAVTVVRANAQPTAFELMQSNGVRLSACSLSADFRQDSLPLFVSGYYLSWPELQYMNLTPLPFEITAARKR